MPPLNLHVRLCEADRTRLAGPPDARYIAYLPFELSAMFSPQDWRDVARQVVAGLIVATVLVAVPTVLPKTRSWMLETVDIPRALFLFLLVLMVGLCILLVRSRRSAAAATGSHVEDTAPWKSYTGDRILGVDWRWMWHGTSVENLTPICPKCGLDLSDVRRSMGDPMEPGLAWMLGYRCEDSTCQFRWQNEVEETPEAFKDRVKKHIRREARKKGYPD